MEQIEITMKSVVFHDEDGRITHSGKVDTASLAGTTQSYLGVDELRPDYDSTHQVVAGVLTPRPSMETALSAPFIRANGVDAATLTGVPAGAEVMIIGPQMMNGTADGSALQFSFALPGQYTVVARLFPFVDLEVTIHAV